MNIKIELNRYTRPIEVRESVVQGIVDALMDDMKKARWTTIDSCNDGLFLCKESKKLTADHNAPGTVRVNGIEMDVAFLEMAKAGYYYYCSYEDGRYTLGWRPKPRYNNIEPTEDITFPVFID
jgi:hypothetical protein